MTQAPVAKKPAQLPGKPTQVVKPITVPSAVAEEESSHEHVKRVTSPSTLDKAESMDHLPPAGKVKGSSFPVIQVQVVCTSLG